MMGSTHAATGIPVGVALVGLLGGSPAQMAAGGLLCAGAALASDLDHGNSCATLSHGLFTKIPSKVIVKVSKIAYRTTRTAWEKSHLPRHDPGGHRYLTHTGVFALITGVITYGVSIFPPGRTVIVFLLISFAVRGMCQALPGSNKIDRWPVRTLVSGLGAWLLPVSPIMLGVIMTAGILTHIGADSLTKAGVPFLWPIKIRGQRWCRLKAPFTITTGKSKAEPIISWLSMIAGAVVGLYLV